MSNDLLNAIYGKIAGSEVTGGGVYLVPGVYKVRVESAFFKQSRKGKTLFIVECSILESSTPLRPAGTSASWTCNLTDHDSAPGNVKAFIGVCLGVPGNDTARMNAEITPAVVSGSTGPNNPLGGLVLHVEVTPQETKSGGTFSRHNWGPVIGRDPNWSPKVAAPALPAAVPGFPSAPAGWAAPTAPRVAPPPPVPMPPPPLPPVAFPPAGWQVHPSAPGWYWNPTTNEIKTEIDLRG